VAARAGDARYQGYYHLIQDRRVVDAYEAGLGQVFPSTAPGNFTYCEPLKAWVWTTFYPFQWDLNWANRDVFAEMAAVILGLANRGAEGFRLDSAAYLWKRLGAACLGEPETHLVLRALRAILAIAAPGVLLKSEVIAPVAETVRYFGSDAAPECHLAYHSGLMTAGWAALAEGRADLVRQVLAEVPALPGGAGWITYVRCHDDIGWMTLAPQAGATPQAAQARLAHIAEVFTRQGPGDYAQGESFQTGDGVAVHGLNGMAASLTGLESAADPAAVDLAIDRLMLLYSLAFAAGGLPVIYMGDELGQTNDNGFRADPLKAHEGRWLHRPVFDDAKAAESGDPATLSGRIRHRMDRLVQARRSLPPLGPDSAPVLIGGLPEPVLGFRRGPDHLALFNVSAAPQTVNLPGEDQAAWTDLLSGEATGSAMVLAAHGSAWLKRTAP
jgi:amylosucrase